MQDLQDKDPSQFLVYEITRYYRYDKVAYVFLFVPHRYTCNIYRRGVGICNVFIVTLGPALMAVLCRALHLTSICL